MQYKAIKSPNFSRTTRKSNKIKFLVIHYTGMQSKRASIARLISMKHEVSCHYLIDRRGKITQMVEDNRVAWHAGKSKWKNVVNLNKYSIGIELVNKGHQFGYENFSKIQIINLIKVCIKLKKKYKIKKINVLGHSDIAPLRKLDPGEKFPWKKLSKYNLGTWYKDSKKNFSLVNKKKIENLFFKNLYIIGYRYFNVKKKSKKDKFIIKAFQRRYLPQKVTGKIDQKTLKISHFLAKQ